MTPIFAEEDKTKTGMTYATLLKGLWPFFARQKFLLFFCLACAVLVAVAGRTTPFVFGYAIEHGLMKKNFSLVTTLALSYLALEALHMVFGFLYTYYFSRFGNRVLFDIRHALINKVQSLPMTYFHKNPSGRIITRLTNDVSTLGDVFYQGLIDILLKGFILVGIIIAMFLVSPKLAVLVLLPTPIFVYLSLRLSNQIREILRESKKKLSAMNSFLAESLNGIKVIQLYNRSPRAIHHFQTLSGEYRHQQILSIKKYAAMQPVMNLFTAATITAALYLGGLMSLEGGLAVGGVVTFLMHVQDFIPPLREILEKYQQFQNSLTSAERIFQIFDERSEPPFEPTAVRNSWARDAAPAIRIEGLSFQYSPEMDFVLKEVSFSIPAGKRYALIGRTGSGKTTLISLLQRFYEPPPKTVFINEKPIESLDLFTLRKHVGVVQQDSFLFRGTLSENISLNDPHVSKEQIRAAAESIGYDRLLRVSGRSLDYSVEERGANLSVGERQIIAFLRVLVFAPPILILDEATANIDSETEQVIQEAIEKVTSQRTSLIIAHRLSTIRHCDQILFLENGRIVESGNHDELIQLRGRYYLAASAGENLISTLS